MVAIAIKIHPSSISNLLNQNFTLYFKVHENEFSLVSITFLEALRVRNRLSLKVPFTRATTQCATEEYLNKKVM